MQHWMERSQIELHATRHVSMVPSDWWPCMFGQFMSLRCLAPSRFKNQQHITTVNLYQLVYGRCSIWWLWALRSEVMSALTSTDFAYGELQYIFFATWRDCGMTEPWRYNEICTFFTLCPIYTVYVLLKAVSTHVKLLCSTPCPAHPSHLSHVASLLHHPLIHAWLSRTSHLSLQSTPWFLSIRKLHVHCRMCLWKVLIVYAAVRANCPAQYVAFKCVQESVLST